MPEITPIVARRYFELVDEKRSPIAEAPPVCVYLEVTNRCNLLCETCPRTFEELEPPADMSWELFTSIVDQLPGLTRAVLHGVGEPMMVKNLPRMIRYLKQRGVYVLFNTNGTLLAPRKRREIIDTGLDELRVSLDAAEAQSFFKVRGKNFFDRIVRNVGEFIALQKEIGASTPRVSLWLTGLKETVEQLPDFVRLAARIGVTEVYLQRLVFDDLGRGLAREESSLFEKTQREEEQAIAAAQALGRELGVTIDASGATEPGASLKRGEEEAPWSTCRRPWSLMYFTAHGRALPCCIAPFSARGYETYTLGNATQADLARDLERQRVPGFSRRFSRRYATKTVPELRIAMEPVAAAVVIPTFNEAQSIKGVVAEIPRELASEIIVVDGGSDDGTQAIAASAGARVISVGARGYGRACMAGVAAASSECGIIVFMDGDGADRGDLMMRLVEPIRRGEYDFVIASRARGEREPGAMSWHQLLAGYLAGLGTKALYGVRYTDMCAYRAIRRDCLERLGMREMTYGWNIEMQMRAARAGLRILELPMPYRRRSGGASKVAGSLRGSLRAAVRIVATFARVATAPSGNDQLRSRTPSAAR